MMNKKMVALTMIIILICACGCAVNESEDSLQEAFSNVSPQPIAPTAVPREPQSTLKLAPPVQQNTTAADIAHDAEYYIARSNRFNGGLFMDTPQGPYMYVNGGLFLLDGTGVQLVATHAYGFSDLCLWEDYLYYLASDGDGMPKSMFRLKLGETAGEMVQRNNFDSFVIVNGYAYFHVWESEVTRGEPNVIYRAPLENLSDMTPVYRIEQDCTIEHLCESDGMLYLLARKEFEGNGIPVKYIAIDAQTGKETILGDIMGGAYYHPIRAMAADGMLLLENEDMDYAQYARRMGAFMEEIKFRTLGDIHYDGTNIYALQATYADASLPIELTLVKSDDWGKTCDELLTLSGMIPAGHLPYAQLYRAKDALYIRVFAVSQDPEDYSATDDWLLRYDIAAKTYGVVEALSASPQVLADDPLSEKSLAIITDMYEKGGKRYMQLDYVNAVEMIPQEDSDDGNYGVRIENNNAKLRTFEIGEECVFRLPDKIDKYGTSQENKSATYEKMEESYKKKPHSMPLYFNVTIQDGLVVRCELWVEYYIGS
ncbi:hypothetical protein LJC27_06265 [Christensenellaceae bacterium OttesenSCG-928-M15]|nr:hypothetical protein [Christensenellaceae bacterium OttesenSCG-928-M15]